MSDVQFTTIDDMKDPFTLLLKGAPGTGKTTVASQFPNAVIINLDKNLTALKQLPAEKRQGLRVVDPYNINGKAVKAIDVWHHTVDLIAKLAQSNEVKTIIVDSATILAAKLEDFCKGTDDPNKPMAIQNWGQYNANLDWIGENILKAADRDKNFILIAHERPIYAKADGKSLEQVIDKYEINLGTNSMRSKFEIYFQDIWRMSIAPSRLKANDYIITTKATQQFMARTSLDLPNSFSFAEQAENIFKQIM